MPATSKNISKRCCDKATKKPIERRFFGDAAIEYYDDEPDERHDDYERRNVSGLFYASADEPAKNTHFGQPRSMAMLAINNLGSKFWIARKFESISHPVAPIKGNIGPRVIRLSSLR